MQNFNISVHELNSVSQFISKYMVDSNGHDNSSKTKKDSLRIEGGKEIIAKIIDYKDIPAEKGRNAAMISKPEIGLEHIKSNIRLLLEAEKPFFLVTNFFSEKRCCAKFEIKNKN